MYYWKWSYFWVNWGLRNCVLKMNRFYITQIIINQIWVQVSQQLHWFWLKTYKVFTESDNEKRIRFSLKHPLNCLLTSPEFQGVVPGGTPQILSDNLTRRADYAPQIIVAPSDLCPRIFRPSYGPGFMGLCLTSIV